METQKGCYDQFQSVEVSIGLFLLVSDLLATETLEQNNLAEDGWVRLRRHTAEAPTCESVQCSSVEKANNSNLNWDAGTHIDIQLRKSNIGV